MDGVIILNRITDVAMLKQNIIEIKQSLKSGVKFLLVAKANGYGCGAECVATLEDLVDYYGVARASEGERLRLLGVRVPILVLSFDKDECDIIAQCNLEVAISSPQEFAIAQSHGIKRVHIAVDTGMNRFGIKTLEELTTILAMCTTTKIVGIFSHIYHNSLAVKATQNLKFTQFINVIKAFTPDILCHIASSGSFLDENFNYNMVRVGLQCYKRCMKIVSTILTVKHINAYEDVGYNGEFVSNRAMKIAVVQGGYADGIDKRLNKISVNISRASCKILGAICMDSFMVDVTDVEANIGDAVIILDSHNIDSAIALSGMSEYELLTGLKGRYSYATIN